MYPVADLRARVEAVLPTVRELRHRLHAAPEVNPNEHATRRAVAAALADLPLTVREPYLGTDLVAELDAGAERTICLRADIDALPMAEAGTPPWRSLKPGAMHACGHDGHTAMLVGAARILADLREHLPVNVRFVFQPGEESVCRGKELVAAGAVEGCVAAFALHGCPGRPVGAVATRPGTLFAAGDFFTVVVRGKGGHAGIPERNVNPLTGAAPVIAALAELHDRWYAAHGAVVGLCMVHGGSANNIVPDTVRLEGTVRYLDADHGPIIEAEFVDAVNAATGPGLTAEVDYQRVYRLPVVNTPAAVDYLHDLAAAYLPAAAWRPEEKPVMTSEDFAFYLDAVGGAMYWLGLGDDHPGLHTPTFDFNDEALPTGILMHAATALNYP